MCLRGIGFGIIALGVLSGSAYADVQMQIQLGFNRHYAIGSFTPLWVQLANGGRDGIRGLLEVSQELEIAPKEIVKETYSWPVELPGGSKKMLQVSLPIHAYTDQIQIALRDEKDVTKVYQSQEIQLHKKYLPELQKLVLALSDAPFPHKLPTGESLQIIGVEQLVDDSKGYGGVRRIYLGRILSSFSKAQQQALKNWLLGGGELVIFSGENWHRQKSPFLEELIPMKVSDTNEIQLDGNRLTIVTGEPHGVVLLRAPGGGQDAPILIKHSFGAGTIFFSTINPLAAEINGFWELLKPQKGEEEDETQSPLEFLGRLGLPLPSVLKVSGLVIVFITGFGLLGLLAIRDERQGRPLTWVLFLWVLGLSGAAALYMSNPALSKPLRSLEAGICRGLNEEGAFCQLWYGVSSRKTADLSLSTRSTAAVQQLLPARPGPHLLDAHYAYDKDNLSILMRVEDRQQRRFYLESPQKAAVTFSLEEGERTPVVRVYNRSDGTLFDAVFIKEGKAFCLGEVKSMRSQRVVCSAEIKAQAVTEKRLDARAEMPDYFESFPSESVEEKIKRTLFSLAKTEELGEALLVWSQQEELVTDPREEKTVIKLIVIGR